MTLGDAAFATSREIWRSSSLDELASVFAAAIAPLRLTAAASGMVTGPKANSPQPFHFTNWPKAWLALYLERDFLRKDPLPRWALISGLPVPWSRIKAGLRANDPGREVYAEAERWGYTEGLAIPLRSRSGALGLVSVGGDRGAILPEEETFLTILSTAAFHKANDFCAGEARIAVPVFSRREQELLNLLRHGLTDREISDVLDISIDTVRTHIENAREKVGARSRTHLVGLTNTPFVH